ncbi:hypothetical protein MAR_012000 [Mya arenaria]|uniref:Uncharacterized protein n=1 Tax=Mya arenaria TaxID=6604 RepID=A0ABY7FZQ8_MYAAR|nr:hypothetical protein MAR_012000 [Mya arenaria]
MADGVLNMTEDIQYHMILSNLNIAPSGRIEGSDLIIETTNVKVEEGGVINLSERGDIKMGDGGGYYNSSAAVYNRGPAYGYFREPTTKGSGSDSSYGGGILKIEASGTVEIDGEIKADGGKAGTTSVDGVSGSYGGAAGGSIWITCEIAKIKGA